jgi:hypothetical protein
MTATPAEKPKVIYVLLYIVGGAFLGTGILNLYWSFGNGTKDLNSDFAEVGFSGIDNIQFLDNFDMAIPFIVGGLACLVIANMNAWKETDGY